MVEGAKVLGEAIAAGAVVEAVYAGPDADRSEACVAVLEQAVAIGIRVFALREGVLERVSDTVSPQPLVGVVARLDVPLDEVLGKDPIVVCADVRDPGNLGAIIRSADAAGAGAVVLSAGTGDLYNPKVVRASAGSLFHLPVVLGGEILPCLDALGRAGYRRYGTTASGGEDYATTSYPSSVALVLGNEAAGLSDALLEHCDAMLSIPIAGGAESLNVAMAGTVLLFELARRRRVGPGLGPSMT